MTGRIFLVMATLKRIYGQYYGDFEKGHVYAHDVTKTILESDNNLFSLITMNHHPVHLDNEFAKDQYHGKILVVGTLIFSIVVGMSVGDISGKAIANLGYENITHEAPVFIGDTINAETEIISQRWSQSKPDRGIVYVETRAFNQNNKLVLKFRRNVLIPLEVEN